MNDIRDIKGPVAVTEPAPPWPLWAGAGGLALAGLTLTGLAVWRWRRLRHSAPRPVEAILTALAALGPDGGTHDDREYYFQLTALARAILHTRSAIPATALTRTEIAAAVDHSALAPAQAEALCALLARAEQACFAAAPVTRADRARDWQTAAALAAPAARLGGGRP
ncbi:hypothetical protein GTA51_00405 [Desulfovibrio aerotolerans]|uniref:DUF4381 family protein n=1 Tax=Solidesulfovibrio aerotolerans TaxID=295255 RepID=A0A7C9J6E3_9BACT|nr:hypothetical protein [Solidesulfovibrio aerotolerans]MYL81598.1 hypothetical protein [Solidesulfovibrio aerotolerans]